MNELKGQIVVITGASSGIGALMAQRFAAEGAFPILLARSEGKLREIAAGIGAGCGYYGMDVSCSDAVAETFQKIYSEHGRVDILINNAGYGVFEKLADADLDTIEDMMNVNYMGTVRCIKAVLPHMLQQRRGHIVNIASMAGKVGSAKSSGYSATKHAILGLTACLRQEVASSGITITAINPGPIDTPFFDRADPTGAYVNHVKWFMLRPDKVAAAVVDAVLRRKAEVNLPFTAAFGVKVYQLFPRLFDRVAGKLLNKK